MEAKNEEGFSNAIYRDFSDLLFVVPFSKKRTHAEMSKTIEESEDEKNDSPWISENTTQAKHPLVRLHNEILDFCNYVTPTKNESERREKAINM